jgi:hypothetical protein
VAPAPLNFGEVRIDRRKSKAVHLSNAAPNRGDSIAITSIAIQGSGPFAENNNCGGSLAPGQTCNVTVSFSPTEKGPAENFLVISNNSRTGQTRVRLRGTGK